MERRDFIKHIGIAGGVSALSASGLAQAVASGSPGGAATAAASRSSMLELLDTLREVQAQFLSERYNITSTDDIAEGQRLMAHLLETGLNFWLEADPERPVFKPYVTTSRKLLGDNPDAIYYFAPIRDDRSYRIRGNLGGATFTSFTIETGSGEGRAATGSSAALDDTDMMVESDGSFEITVSRKKPKRGNWLKLEPGSGQVTTRHYFESRRSIAADPNARVPLHIEPLDPPKAKPFRNDKAIAQQLQYVANFVREHMAMSIPDAAQIPDIPWASRTPNQFTPPGQWKSESGYGNLHAWYAMAPFVLRPNEALVIESRFPPCRFANLVLWNRYMQTFDYTTHPASFNRKQIEFRDDGSFRLVLAHKNPGEPNWLSTEGRHSGVMYWRWLLPVEAPPTPKTEVIKV